MYRAKNEIWGLKRKKTGRVIIISARVACISTDYYACKLYNYLRMHRNSWCLQIKIYQYIVSTTCDSRSKPCTRPPYVDYVPLPHPPRPGPARYCLQQPLLSSIVVSFARYLNNWIIWLGNINESGLRNESWISGRRYLLASYALASQGPRVIFLGLCRDILTGPPKNRHFRGNSSAGIVVGTI